MRPTLTPEEMTPVVAVFRRLIAWDRKLKAETPPATPATFSAVGELPPTPSRSEHDDLVDEICDGRF